MGTTATDAASIVNFLINTVLLVTVFIAKWELGKIEKRIHRIENIFFSRGVREIVKQTGEDSDV